MSSSPSTSPDSSDASESGGQGTHGGQGVDVGGVAPPDPAAGGGRSFAAELPVLIVIAFVLALVLKTFLVQAFYIPSGSMEPTLAVGDRVLVNKVVYDLRDPHRGEIIVFGEAPLPLQGAGQSDAGPVRRFAGSLARGLGLAPPLQQDFIKRIIGLPGDTIEQRHGEIHINGEPLRETTVAEGGYISARDPQNDFPPLTVPDGEYFVMGDNRPNSSDSRFSLGTIARDDIVGRAFVVIWPLDRVGRLSRAEYGPQAAGGGVLAPRDLLVAPELRSPALAS